MSQEIRRAFQKAMEDNPNSPLTPVIKSVNKAQATERIAQERRREQEKRLVQLRQQFYDLGLLCLHTQADESTVISYGQNRIPIEQKRERWTQGLTILKNRPSEERIELLNCLASGMQLTSNHAPRVYVRSILQIEFNNPLGFLRDEISGVNFNFPSLLFMEAISDMSGHSGEQKQEFRDFMTKKSGLKGKIGLPQLFPGISRWIDHAK